MIDIFEWERILFNDLPYEFVFEVIFRSFVMFMAVLIALRASGKRGVKQLSIFELVIIITLGSAAGDPMFYEDVGIIPAITVFISIILLYRGVTWLTAKNKLFEKLVEGKAVCLINEGRFSIDKFKKEDMALEEFFSELREKSVEHLGQVRIALLETSGELSVFFYADKEVKYGLPLIPTVYDQKSKTIAKRGTYACTYCGNIQELKPGTATCVICKKEEWVAAINSVRIA